MNLEEIGFYTLSDDRATHADETTPVSRAEIILTSSCNFNCAYCRGGKPGFDGTQPLRQVLEQIDRLAERGLKAIRFSGGEPTICNGLDAAIRHAREKGVERIAVSTNGSAPWATYRRLILAGANDFSVSLDACCASTGDAMAGGIPGRWQGVVQTIRALSRVVYTTVGVVITEDNVAELRDTILFAHRLGVADIRIIPASQVSDRLPDLDLPAAVLEAHPILRYRLANLSKDRPVRGISPAGCGKCPLVLDDVAIAGNHHFPCIIYLREHGEPIAEVGPDLREDRRRWFEATDVRKDPICSKNCLDVCVEYNRRWEELHA
jgi:MoaA/NifB/PqqE/SkfB family radical SAM enzyme